MLNFYTLLYILVYTYSDFIQKEYNVVYFNYICVLLEKQHLIL